MSTEKRRYYSRFPKALNECVEPLIQPVLKEKGLAGSRIITDWAKIVGAQLASRSQPEKLSFPRGKTTEGTLTIAVENGFATDLQYQAPLILERLAVYFGYKAISRIIISHTLTRQKRPQKPAATTKSLSPIPEDMLNDIEDLELKEALSGLGSIFQKAQN
ncbi:MAG: DUF721 domain-containing protein [Alphaproteobacteria bacterium]